MTLSYTLFIMFISLSLSVLPFIEIIKHLDIEARALEGAESETIRHINPFFGNLKTPHHPFKARHPEGWHSPKDKSMVRGPGGFQKVC